MCDVKVGLVEKYVLKRMYQVNNRKRGILKAAHSSVLSLTRSLTLLFFFFVFPPCFYLLLLCLWSGLSVSFATAIAIHIIIKYKFTPFSSDPRLTDTFKH